MGVLGGAIGAGLGAVGSIFGGIAASKAMKSVKNNLQEQRRKNQDWYNRSINEDPTQRASAQAILTRVEDTIRKRNKQAAGVQAVMGGTEESVAAAKEANNEALATATTNIAVNGEARKDAIESQYQQNDANIQQQLNDLEKMKAGNISQAIQGVTGTAGNIGSLIDDYAEKKAGTNIAGIL